jgi:hypothetical protein
MPTWALQKMPAYPIRPAYPADSGYVLHIIVLIPIGYKKTYQARAVLVKE